MGDYVNLSVELDLDLANLTIPDIACIPLNELPNGTPLDDLVKVKDLCAGVTGILQDCLTTRFDREQMEACASLPQYLLDEVCDAVTLIDLCGRGGGGGGGGGSPLDVTDPDGPIGDLLGNLGLGRPATGAGSGADAESYDEGLGLFLGAPLTDGGAVR
jgi:phospholipid/cholesterol/gamma-HCH transport system substrate-binding protein